MLGIGLSELILIGVVLLLVVPADELPKLMRELGRRYGQLRRAADDLRRAFVLEADRQDAQERYRELQERRRLAQEARKRALEEAGEGVVAQEPELPGTADVSPPEDDAELPVHGFEDPETPAPRHVFHAHSGDEVDAPTPSSAEDR